MTDGNQKIGKYWQHMVDFEIMNIHFHDVLAIERTDCIQFMRNVAQARVA